MPRDIERMERKYKLLMWIPRCLSVIAIIISLIVLLRR